MSPSRIVPASFPGFYIFPPPGEREGDGKIRDPRTKVRIVQSVNPFTFNARPKRRLSLKIPRVGLLPIYQYHKSM